jgi:hypothetical protein
MPRFEAMLEEFELDFPFEMVSDWTDETSVNQSQQAVTNLPPASPTHNTFEEHDTSSIDMALSDAESEANTFENSSIDLALSDNEQINSTQVLDQSTNLYTCVKRKRDVSPEID